MINNNKYIDLVRARLKENGYVESEVDRVATKVIAIANSQEIDVMLFLEDYFLKQPSNASSVQLNQSRNGTSFTSKRHSTPEPNRFIKRQIILK